MKQYKELVKEMFLTVSEKNSNFLKSKILTSQDCYNYIKQFYFDDIEIYESFYILLLNSAHNTVGYAKISQGGVAGTVCDPIIVAKYAVDTLACAVILAHNHPSGNTRASGADIELTKKIKNTLSLFGCTVLDHIILTKDSYFSFSDGGLI